MMADLLKPERLLLLLGLTFFFGLAFEGFYHVRPQKPPGGVRTFPLLSLLGVGLYVAEPHNGLAFVAGLVVVGVWILIYYDKRIMTPVTPETVPDAGIMAPVCNLVAYALGPITILAPVWFSVGVTVTAVLLVSARERLHELAYSVPGNEIITLGKFLVLTGIVLPLLPNQPIAAWTAITPYQVWLAVIAVSALSYGSYLARRYLPIGGSVIVASVLGGLYSSTATTVVIARRLRTDDDPTGQLKGGMVLATALMYVRLGIIIAVFNLSLAKALAPTLAILCVLALVLTAFLLGRNWLTRAEPVAVGKQWSNPLELTAAVVFAGSFVLITLASSWAKTVLGQTGVFWLAGIVGVTDIDPFVLSVAQGGIGDGTVDVLTIAILIAASSNNLLKAVYAVGFSGSQRSRAPALALIGLSVAGFAIAAWFWYGSV